MAVNRRKFIGLATIASTGLAFPNIFIPQQKKKIGVALLGLGSYSTYQLAPALQQTNYCYLAAIVTGSTNKVPIWQRKYGIEDANIYNYSNMAEIANNPAIDVIYIVTPTGTHKDFVLKAAAAGKHVWCEKPMAMTEKECEDMIRGCQENKVKLTIGYRVQHEPNTLAINAYAKSLPFGPIKSLDSAAGYTGSGGSGWRFQKNMGGGALYDMGVYTVNGIRNAANREPIEVISARQYADRPNLFKEVDETTEYELLFPDGIRAKGKTSVGQTINHLRIDCTAGWYEMRPMQPYSGVRGSRSDGLQIDKYVPNQQAIQMDDDALAILENRDFMIPPEEGLRDIRIIESIIRSSETGKSVPL